ERSESGIQVVVPGDRAAPLKVRQKLQPVREALLETGLQGMKIGASRIGSLQENRRVGRASSGELRERPDKLRESDRASAQVRAGKKACERVWHRRRVAVDHRLIPEERRAEIVRRNRAEGGIHRQVNGMVSGISDLEDHAFAKLALNIEIPPHRVGILRIRVEDRDVLS